MATGGLAKLKLELEIDGDKVVVTGLERVDSAVDQLSRRTKTATEQMAAGMGNVETATGKMAAGISGMIRSVFDDMTGLASGIQTVNAHIFSLIAAAGMIAAPFLIATATIKKGVEVVDDFALSNIQIAAQITQMQGPKDVVEHYRKASEYAAVLSLKIQEMDANSLANNKGLMAMTQTMAMQGVLLDVNNRKQVDAATALSNAIAAYTKGQDQQVQFYQETRALMSGQVDMHAQVSRAIDQAIRQEGKYKDGLKEVVELGKQHGDLLERLSPYLVGMNAATADINKTWTAATSSMETTISLITRAGFVEIYRDAVDWLQQGNTYLRQHATEIGGVIKASWRDVKGLIEGSVTLLQVGIGGSLPILQAVGSEVKFITKGIAEFFDLLRLAPGLLVPLGVAAFYAVGGLAAFEAGYIALTGVIAASMATNPVGWLALGITAIAVAARPAINYLDQLLQKYSGLAEAQQNAATADANWEAEKKRQRWMYEEGGRSISPGMMKELGLVNTPTVKSAPTLKKEDFEKFDINSATSARLLSAQKQTEQLLSLERHAADADLAILKEWHEKGLISQKVYNDSVYDVQKAALDKEIAIQEEQVTRRLEQNRAANAALLKSGATEKNGVITVHTAEENKLLTHAWEAYGRAIEAQTKLNDLKNKSNALDAAKPLQVYKDEVAEKKALNDATLLSIQMQLDNINAQEKLNQLTTGDAAAKKIDLLQQQLDLERQIYEQNTKLGPEADLLRMKQREAIQKTNQALLDNQDILSKSTFLGGATASLQEYTRMAMDTGSQTRNMVTSMLKGMEDALVRFVTTGKLSFKDLTKSIISDLVRIGIQRALAGGLGMIGSSLFGTAAIAGTAATAGAAATGGTAATAGLLGAGGVGLAMSNFGGAIAAGWAGGFGAIGGIGGSAGVGMSIGAAAAVVAPIAAAAAATYVITKYGFGMGNRWQSTGTGVDLQINSDGTITGQTWEEFKKKGGWFTSDRYRREYKALTDAQSLSIQTSFDVIQEALRYDAAILGNAAAMTAQQLNSITMASTRFRSMADFLAAYATQVTQDLFAGFGEWVEQFHTITYQMDQVTLPEVDSSGMRLENQIVGEDGFIHRIVTVTQVVSDGLQFVTNSLVRSGETVTDARTRIASSLNTIRTFFAMTGQLMASLSYDEALQVGDTASNLIARLQAMAGGEAGKVDAAQSALNSYSSSNLFSEQEQAANRLNNAVLQVNTSFAALGIAVPHTNAEFRELVNNTYALAMAGGEGSDAAATLWSQLIRLAPTFAETTQSVQTMVDATVEANNRLIDAAKKTLSDSISTTQTLLGAMKTILTGSLANLSPTDAYAQTKAQWASADATNAGERSQAFLEASKALNASGPAYWADRQGVLDKLGQLAQTAPTLSFVEQQIKLLGEIKAAVDSGSTATVAALGVTFNAAQIDMGLANNQLSLALQSIQTTLDTPVTAGTARPALEAQIAALQTALNNNGQPLTGSAADSVRANIGLLQLALNGTISSAVATQGINSSYSIVQGALNGIFSGTLAANGIAAQYATIQAAANGTITGAQAAAALGQQYAIIQAAANGTITGSTAAAALQVQYATIQAAANGTITGAQAATALSQQYAVIQAAANSTINGATASAAIATQAAIIQQAANGTITGSQAAAAFSTQYGIIQQAANGGISAAVAQSQIQSQYAAVTNALGTGISGALTPISTALQTFTEAISASGQATSASLARFITAMEIMQSYPTKLADYNALRAKYASGTIDIDAYAAQAATMYTPLNDLYNRGVSAGLTTLTAPSATAVTADMIDQRMMAVAVANIDNIMKMSVGAMPADMKYDLGPMANGKITRDGVINTIDVLEWLRLSKGLDKWSTNGLPAFADGGIAYRPSIFGEAGPEAAVPLPDGRRIPVQLSGSADNRETVAELKEQNRLLRELLAEKKAANRISVAGFKGVIDVSERQDKRLRGMENKAELQAVNS